jgi:hypothetical protein
MYEAKLGRYEEPLREKLVSARQQQPFTFQMEMMEKNIARLKDLLIQLESKLSPLTRPIVATSSPTPEPDSVNSPATQRLAHYNSLLEMVANDVGALHDALEV